MLNVEQGEAYVELLRVDNPLVTGSRDVIFSARAAGAPFNQVTPDSPEGRTMTDVLASDVIGEGSDNTFANAGGTNYNNIERISFMRRTPITPSDATRVGLTIMERGGNDPFKVAAVTAVDGNGNPTAWGPLLKVTSAAWGGTVAGEIVRTESTVLREDDADAAYRPSATTGDQKLAGMYISMADLSVTAGTPIYGVSMIPQDQTTVGGPFANLATIESGPQGAGIDLIGGIFVSGIPLSASPVTGTDTQGTPQQIPLDYVPNDLSQINTDLARLIPPADGTVNDDGTAVTVPGEGTYTLDRDTLVVTFFPEPDFTGEATPVGYEITDVNGLTATSIITPTVIQVAVPDTSTGPQGVPQTQDVLANDNPDGDVDLVPATRGTQGAPQSVDHR